ncbi:hypothetical protein ALO92_100517 [Pseudomonas congelans]|uniref:Uncharacterized protein n=1 Tax=Pseudomonas congelans TaxID=200452 RepID=A0A0N8R1T6_9PSED|nr:hypothetical protein ALO92_100517 [Pseudomonas congelans]
MRQDSSVTEVNVPVVGTQEGQAVRHWGFQAGQTRWECYRKRLSQASAIKFCMKLPIAPLSVGIFCFAFISSGASRAPAIFSPAQHVCQPPGDGYQFPDASGEH